MCPVCLATAVLIAGSVTSTGGLLGDRNEEIRREKRRGQRAPEANPVQAVCRREREQRDIVPNSNQRRGEDGNRRD